MKWIIWSYKFGRYIKDENQINVKFNKRVWAEKLVHMHALADVEMGIEKNLTEAKENGYLIEEIID